VRRIFLAALAALALAAPAAAFTPTDPLAGRQWYLAYDRAFELWAEPPVLAPVKVAVIDSGIDPGHPEFAGKVVASKSFVGGGVTDVDGHGTFVAGEIAAALDNGEGIAGIAFSAQLLIAKVVRPDGTIAPEDEAQAIRWAVAHGARVINLSVGGLRDPADLQRDTYSAAEENAIEYAASKGVVVVAAVGNADEAPSAPWPYASYPAALPHVIGVAALTQSGSVPVFSNRDAVFDDLAAPGVGILSTFPRALTAQRPACADQGYSDCGPQEYVDAEGTSFAAPQVSAAAALLFASRPELTREQVAFLLEHTAVDVGAPGRDSLSGWGRLDVTAALEALSGPLPPRDHYEANDDAGGRAATIFGRTKEIDATVDFWDDPVDVYRIKLQAGQYVSADLRGPAGTNTNLVLWKPGTERVEGRSAAQLAQRATASLRTGANQHLLYRARAGGWYYLEVKLATPGFGAYTLRFSKSP
jgi:subtilisin family serine protease